MGKVSRFSIVLLSIALALWGLYPSVWWYFLADQEQRNYANMTRGTLAEELRLQVEEDVLKFQKFSYEDKDALASEILPSEQAYILDVAKRYRREYKLEAPETWSLAAIGSLFGGDETGRELMRENLEDYKLEEVLVYRNRKNNSLRLGLDLNGGQSVIVRPNAKEFEARVSELEAESNQRSSDIEAYLQDRIVISLQNRVDQFGLTEPEIHSFQDGRIEIVVPSQSQQDESDASILESLLQVKGSLEFHLVNDAETERVSNYLNVNPSREFTAGITKNGQIPGYDLPAGQVIRGYYEKDKYGMDRLRGYLVLESDVLLDGENITSAQLNKDNLGQWEINYNLNQEGAADQQKIFTQNPGRMMAIVLNQRVLSYPRISENAGSGGSYNAGRITGRFSEQEAKDLVNVLNSGNLPVSLDIDSQRVVGATLGEESIRSGLIGIAVGLLAVVLFMMLYYRSAGVIADIALILNLFFLIAILATMNSTLTLTGIAGVILTIGMSVDANVIIYERIKEELLAGKNRRAAIEVGYSRAFWTIIDANITTGIAAICLALFGNGAIQGFAITLAWGIVCSLFTALFITRLIFDFNTDVFKFRGLAIAWRRSGKNPLGGV